MSTVSNAMLKKCLLKSVLAEIKELEAMDYSNIKASKDLEEKIKGTINGEGVAKKKHFSKKVAIALAAAIILGLSTMLAVSAGILSTVADFFVKAYETYTRLIVVEKGETDIETSGSEQTQAPATIETEYVPSYIKSNGYLLLDKIKNDNAIFTVWSNDSYIIDLTQNVISDNDIVLDTENTLLQVAWIGEQKVYYIVKNNTYTIKWLAYGYSFNMSCDEALGWEEVEKIILSIEPAAGKSL